MLAERNIHSDIRDMLLSNEPFQYAHLIKFERPSRPDSNSGQVSTSKERYTYLTDASRDVMFDDGSTSVTGVPNGVQNYIANKVLKVSSVAEDTEAKASSFSLVLDGNGIGAYVKSPASVVRVNATTWDIEFTKPNTDLIKLGFREGDKVSIGKYNSYNIKKFKSKRLVRVTKIDTDLPAGTSPDLDMFLNSDEIVSILTDKNSDSYSSFVNREVFIYRSYFQSGKVVGTPFLLFKGIISAVGFEDSETALTVTWTLSSHWGDFSQVKGRITSDDFHRALDQNGVPQPASALKVSYAYDKGFSHSETSLNILAQYSVQVEKQDVKVKKGFLGIGSKVKVKKYYVSESRNSELDFQLQAKSIPVIYGVRNTSGIPIFADTLKNDSSTVYVVQALGEGEMGGIYDAYIEGNSLICNDKSDFDARSVQTPDETVQLICRGRADRGDVLGGTTSIATTTYTNYYDYYYSDPSRRYSQTLDYDLNYVYNFPKYVEPTTTKTDRTGAGVFDGQSITLTSPQQITMDFFSGKAGQKAASSLVSIAKANNFKIQNDYWNGINTADYWGPNHRLLDTAYVVNKFKIEEGETTIPTIDYVVRGKTINCYNYDKSYTHYDKVSGENADNFSLGAFVSLERTDGTSLIQNVQIIDKWTITRADGKLDTRFRFSIDPPLTYVNGVPRTTLFRMKSGANTWTMITFNHKEVEGTVPSEQISTVTGASNNAGYVQFSFNNTPLFTVGGDPMEDSSVFSIVDSNGNAVSNYFFGNSVLVGAVTPSTLTTKYSWSAAGPSATQAVGRSIVRRNIVALPASASGTDNFYTGASVTVTHTDPITSRQTSQTRKIISYNGANKIATIEGLWDYGLHPKVGDAVSITPAYADSRVSINTPIQLLDFITSTTYGRGLDPFKDLNLESWLRTARKADAQSNVTVKTSSAAGIPTAGGEIYRYPASGNIIWQGTVVGSDNGYVEFTDVIGKLTNNWNSWKSYNVGELVYADTNLYLVTSAGVKATKPTHSGTTNGLQLLTSLTLTKVSGPTGTNISLVVDGNPVRAEKNGSQVPGYSLYDSDGVDYWRLLGWDEFSQRYATAHQTNIIVDTSLPLLDTVNSFLDHFGGILRYSSGQYYLDMEEAEGPISSDADIVHTITADHIIGKIRLTDEGIRSAYNSLTAAYSDPANKFESRNISFFNSDYLKSDKGVPKKGNVSVPGITNYYNTRILADRFLNRSRFGLTASFNMAPRGILLLSGQVIQLQYPRYNWDNKKFRIINLTHQEDATVDIVAEEYDDSFYGLSKISKQAATGLAGNSGVITAIDAPTNLRASSIDSGDELVSGVEITWVNNPIANPRNVFTELYSSYSKNLYVEVSTISGNVLTTSEPVHGLKAGELISSVGAVNGLQLGKSYFIKDIVSANQFTISETKDGPIKGLTDGTDLGAIMLTANLTATLAIPANAYIDVFAGINGRVQKYYWVRHKVVQGI